MAINKEKIESTIKHIIEETIDEYRLYTVNGSDRIKDGNVLTELVSDRLKEVGIENKIFDFKRIYGVDIDDFILIRQIDAVRPRDNIYIFVDPKFLENKEQRDYYESKNSVNMRMMCQDLFVNGCCFVNSEMLNDYFASCTNRLFYVDIDRLYDLQYDKNRRIG